MIYHTCSIGDRSGDLAGQGNICQHSLEHVELQHRCMGERYPEVAPQTMTPGLGPVCIGRRHSSGRLLTNTLPSLVSKQNRSSENNRSPLRSLMSSGLTPLASQTAMAWSRWNTRYRAPGSKLSLK
ncbi:uncharacterized protein TNCV_4000491 [Trichonephila clavipes]|nr:uncharacterized protein TNCV_4000491 [Trichonephila clavipes]